MVITVKTDVPYNVIIENGAIDKVGEVVASMYKSTTKVMLISETNVFPIYGDRVIKSIKDAGFAVSHFVYEAGEQNKTMETVMQMYKALGDAGFTRTDLIVTLGGGVTGDMGGFAAATFLRGMDFIQVPTSLLSQVDASVGGKTGIDMPFGKNLVGAFHQPRAVITDPETLKTLPEDYLIDGMGEVVKYGAIWDEELFADLESGKALRDLPATIYKCVDCKRQLVEEDAHDKGNRIILNFGHTLGHALEKLHGFSGLSHGRAVAIGMLKVTRLSEAENLTEEGTSDRLEALLKKMHLPTDDAEFPIDKIIDATALDKKSTGRILNLVCIKKIGETFVYKTERNLLVLKYKILEEQRSRNAKA
ncbi:MAG: 3-dehydroquinate synthase [Clostridia bacterium]|nr:3-dehydroquinate synthase [Clostridia bacterium]